MADRNCRPWVKLWADFVDSRQLARAGEQAEWLFHRLLVLCGTDGDGDTLPMGVEDIAWRVRREASDVTERLAALEREGLCKTTSRGVQITGWNARQDASTGAERKARSRQLRADKAKVADAALRSQTDVTTCRALESVLESESESETHTQPPSVPEGPPPEPAVGRACVGSPSAPPGKKAPPPAKTDADLEPWFRAAATGIGQPDLTWGFEYLHDTERIRAMALEHSLTPPDVQRIAAFYASKCRDGTPRFATIATRTQFDRYRSEESRKSARASPAAGKRDDARFGAPSAMKRGACSVHPGGPFDNRGRCERCPKGEEAA